MKAIALKRLYDFALQEDSGQKLLLPYLKQIGAIKEEQMQDQEEDKEEPAPNNITLENFDHEKE